MDAHSFHVFTYSEGCYFVQFFISWVEFLEKLNSDLSSINLFTLELISCYYFNQFNQTLIKVQFLKDLIRQKACGLDYILVVVPKKCDPELSYILAKLFNTCLKECFFADCSKVSHVFLLLLGTTAALQFFFLWVVKYLKNFQIIDLLIA